jgi:CDP-glucose 4,6-dehydratase
MFNNFYDGKRVLVLGHTGFKGAWLTQWVLNLGADVIGISGYIPSNPSLYEVLNLKGKITDYRFDIRDHSQLTDTFKKESPEVVFHLAAQPIVKVSYQDPKMTFDTNLGGTVNIMEAIRSTPSVKSSILITSDKCYENVEWEYGYRENDRLGGKDPYSASKACAEIAIRSYFESFFKGTQQNIASVRAGNVIGGGDWAAHRIIPDCVRSWSDSKKVTIRSPHATRPWQHVLEPLSGYLWLAVLLGEGQHNELSGESFNFGPDSKVNQTVETLIGDLAKIWQGSEWLVDSDMKAEKEAGLLKLCCDKALHRLDWSASLTYCDTVKLTGDWYRAFYQGRDMLELTNQQIDSYCEKARQSSLKWQEKGAEALTA